jgi:hypothetical protein
MLDIMDDMFVDFEVTRLKIFWLVIGILMFLVLYFVVIIAYWMHIFRTFGKPIVEMSN